MSLAGVAIGFADLFVTRRMSIGIVAGGLAALGAQALPEDPLAMRIAVVSVVAGPVTGIVREYRHRHATRR